MGIVAAAVLTFRGDPEPKASEPTTTSLIEDSTTAEGREVPIDMLEVGDCFNLPPDYDPSSEFAPSTALLIPCDRPHESEVYHGFELAPGPYPGDQQVLAQADQQCSIAFEEYVGTDPASSGLDYSFVYPSSGSWTSGDRTGGCALFDALGDQLTGSMATTTTEAETTTAVTTGATSMVTEYGPSGPTDELRWLEVTMDDGSTREYPADEVVVEAIWAVGNTLAGVEVTIEEVDGEERITGLAE